MVFHVDCDNLESTGIHAISHGGRGGLFGEYMNSKLILFGEWIYFLLMLQLLWLMGLLVGGVILGFFSATCASFVVARKRLRKEDVRISREFWQAYQTVFFRSQLEGWIWVFIGLFIYYDMRLMFSYQNIFGFIAGSLFVSLLILYGLCTMITLPVYAYYDLTALDRVRLALMIAVTYPHISVCLSLGTVIIYMIAKILPVLFLLIGISAMILFYTYVATFALQKIAKSGFIQSDQPAPN